MAAVGGVYPRGHRVRRECFDLADGGLGQGVVVAIPDRADRGQRADAGEGVGVANGQVLAAGVAVVDQPVEALGAGPDRHLQGLQRQGGAQVGGQRPADQSAGVHVDD